MAKEQDKTTKKRKRKLVKPSICYECIRGVPCGECYWRVEWHYEKVEA